MAVHAWECFGVYIPKQARTCFRSAGTYQFRRWRAYAALDHMGEVVHRLVRGVRILLGCVLRGGWGGADLLWWCVVCLLVLRCGRSAPVRVRLDGGGGGGSRSGLCCACVRVWRPRACSLLRRAGTMTLGAAKTSVGVAAGGG